MCERECISGWRLLKSRINTSTLQPFERETFHINPRLLNKFINGSKLITGVFILLCIKQVCFVLFLLEVYLMVLSARRM